MSKSMLLFCIVAVLIASHSGHGQGSGSPSTGQWTDADRAALERAWRSNDINETKRLQHKAWASGHQDEIVSLQKEFFTKQNNVGQERQNTDSQAGSSANHQYIINKAVAELACAHKMISFSNTPEYNRAVDACVSKELPRYAAGMENLRGLSP